MKKDKVWSLIELQNWKEIDLYYPYAKSHTVSIPDLKFFCIKF